MARWKDLPVELMIEIVSFVNDRSSIRRTCQQLRNVSEAFVFKSVKLYTEDSVVRFAQLLMQRPSIGGCVRNLETPLMQGGMDHATDVAQYEAHTLSDDEEIESMREGMDGDELEAFDLVLQTLKTLGISKRWVIHPERFAAVHLLILLHLLEHLTALTLLEGHSGTSLVCAAALGKVSGGVPAGLSSLKALIIGSDLSRWSQGSGHFTPEDILPLLEIPSLLTFRIEGLSARWRGDFFTHFRIAPGSVDIEHLQLEVSNIDSESLQHLIAMPKKLVTFVYTTTSDMFEPHDKFPLSGRRISLALAAHSSSLTYLHIGVALYGYLDSVESTIGSLREFPVLRDLDLPIQLLLGTNPQDTLMKPGYNMFIDLLPATLRAFTLSLSFQWGLDAFLLSVECPKTWIDARRTYLVGIESFVIHTRPGDPSQAAAMPDFAASGITICTPK